MVFCFSSKYRIHPSTQTPKYTPHPSTPHTQEVHPTHPPTQVPPSHPHTIVKQGIGSMGNTSIREFQYRTKCKQVKCAIETRQPEIIPISTPGNERGGGSGFSSMSTHTLTMPTHTPLNTHTHSPQFSPPPTPLNTPPHSPPPHPHPTPPPTPSHTCA